MVRSLFLFDMTFWLYLAALTLYIAYLFARRPAMALAPAGHSTDSFDERDGAWATQLGQIATLITVFGWIVNSGALFLITFRAIVAAVQGRFRQRPGAELARAIGNQRRMGQDRRFARLGYFSIRRGRNVMGPIRYR